RLFEGLDPAALRGTIVGGVIANVPGYLGHTREFNDRQDFNRLFPGREDGSSADVWAWRYMQRIVRRFDYLVDLHTASFGRVNTLYVRANMERERTARMALLLRPQIVVHNPAPDSTLRGCA